MLSDFRDSAIVKLNFSEERPPKPPRLYLTKTESPVSVVNSHSVMCWCCGGLVLTGYVFLLDLRTWTGPNPRLTLRLPYAQ